MSISIIINIALATISITFFLQLIFSKKNSKSQLENYLKQLALEIEKRKEFELKLKDQNTKQDLTETSQQNLTIESLLLEIKNLHKEKEQEVKSRLEAEKQIDITIQQTQDLQSRIDDWKAIEEANLEEITDKIYRSSDHLYKMLCANNALEGEKIQKKIDELSQNIYNPSITNQNQTSKNSNATTNSSISSGGFNQELEIILQNSDLMPDVDYFMNHNLPESIRKSVACDALIVLNSEIAIIIDTKSGRIFAELFLNIEKQNADALDIFKQKVDKYLSYLNNPKYYSNIISYFSKQKIITNNATTNLVIVVPSAKEIEAFEELGSEYTQILEERNISLHSLVSFSNLIFGE